MLGVCGGDHRVRVNLFARLQDHANRALTLQQDLLDGGVGADIRAVEARRVCDRGRNGARPTLRERPLAEGAVDLTEVVMEEDHPRPWRLNAKEGANDSRGRHGANERLPLKPAREEVVRAPRDQVEQGALGAQWQVSEILGESGVVEPLVWVAVRIRCWDIDRWADESGDVCDRLLEVVVVIRILMRPLANLADRVRVVRASVKVAVPVRRVGANGRSHLQAVLCKVKLANHLRAQQAHQIRSDRELVARDWRLGERCATKDGASL